MLQCEVCGESLDDDRKVLGQHLWEQHHITPNDYRVRYLGLSPECKRPGCSNAVPRDTNGEWFKCCSPYCALEMGEDIPLLAGHRAAGAEGVPLHLSQVQQREEDRGQTIMSARVCGSLVLLWLAYRLVSGAEINLNLWGVLIILAGLAMVVWGYSAKLPKG